MKLIIFHMQLNIYWQISDVRRLRMCAEWRFEFMNDCIDLMVKRFFLCRTMNVNLSASQIARLNLCTMIHESLSMIYNTYRISNGWVLAFGTAEMMCYCRVQQHYCHWWSVWAAAVTQWTLIPPSRDHCNRLAYSNRQHYRRNSGRRRGLPQS